MQGPESECMEVVHPILPAEFGTILSRSHIGAAALSWLSAAEVPQPYHQLLVHDHDMTSELAGFHGDSITLQVLDVRRSGDDYMREVVLRTATSGAPVEYKILQMYTNEHGKRDVTLGFSAGSGTEDLAALRGVSVDDLARQTRANFDALFRP